MAHALHDFAESEGLAQSGVGKAVFLCGPGQDANMGIVAARHYKQLGTMAEVEVVTLGHLGPEQGLLLALAEEEGVEVSECSSIVLSQSTGQHAWYRHCPPLAYYDFISFCILYPDCRSVPSQRSCHPSPPLAPS